MHAKLGPHRWAEVAVTSDGVRVLREFPCIRAVVYDVATGRITAAHHTCFSVVAHIEGAPHPFAPEEGQAVLVLDRFPVPTVPRPFRDTILDRRGRAVEVAMPAVEEDDLQAIVDHWRVNPATRQLERRP